MMNQHNSSAFDTLKYVLIEQLSPFLKMKATKKQKINLAIACSGGRDSMLLAEICYQVLKEHSEQNQLLIFTVDHGLHAQSKAFAEAVVDYWQARAVNAYRLSADAQLIQAGSGIEDGARRARYEALRQAKTKYSVDFILFGHHAGDQAESILIRLQHSSGLRGLSGIPQQRAWILRPWLNVSPLLINDAFEQLNLPLYEDPSNQDQRFLRNAIRHNISPQCTKVFGQAWHNHFAQSAQHLSEAVEVYDYFLKQYTGKLIKEYAEYGRFKLEWYEISSSVPQALERAVLFQFYTLALRSLSLQSDLRRVKDQLSYLWQIWCSKKTQVLSLPHGLQAWGKRHELWIYHEHYFPKLSKDFQVPFDSSLILKRQSFTLNWGEWRLDLELVDERSIENTDECEQSHLVSLPSHCKLLLRKPKPAERFLPNAASGSKRITRLWSDRKVPIFERDRLPVLSDQQDQLLWIPYCRPHQRLITQSGQAVWRMTWQLSGLKHEQKL